MPSLSRSLRLSAAASVALLPLTTFALSPANRVGQVDSSVRGTVEHNVAGRTKAATDLGPAPATHRMDGVTLFFSRTAAQQAALEALIGAQQNPRSPLYHQWLTPQSAATFGLSAGDLAKVSTWLSSQGLTVTYTAPSNTFLTVSGTVAQLDQAFGTSIHSVLSNGVQHVANVTDPVLPAAIAGIVSGVTGLNDFRPQSHARSQPPSAAAATVAPAFTSSISPNNHYLAPGDFQIIYDSKPLIASAINGTGASIAVIGQTNLALTQVASFRAAAGLPAQVPTVVVSSTAAPTGTGNDLEESQLDVEWAGASAPNASITYVTSATGVFDALQYAVVQKIAPIIAISYGYCEPLGSAAAFASYSALFQLGNSMGETIIASSGDSGATDCDVESVTAADGLAVDFPASSPFVTGIGGTMFNDTTANWQSSSGTDQVISALGYIPETTWNEYAAFGNTIAAGGGGASVYFAKPTWQTGTGVPADYSRDVPDIALNAAASHVGYLYCIPIVSGDSSATVTGCTNGFRNSLGALNVVGGTSAGTPSFAGILALVEQKVASTTGLGNINPTLYGLGGTAAFHDITTGTNASPCAKGSPDCQSASSIGFNAAAGYDQATGLGTIDANNLANSWSSAVVTGAGASTGSTVSVTNVTVPTGTQSCAISTGSLTINVSVAGLTTNAVVPTGSVQLVVDGSAVGTPVTLTAGAAAIVVNTANLSSGAHSVAALYAGDAVYAASKSYLGAELLPSALAPNTVVDVVSASTADFALTPCFPTVTVRSGATATPLTLNLTAFNGFSGPVALTVSTDSSLSAGYTFSASPVTISSSTAGTSTLTFSAFTTNSNALSGSAMRRIPTSGSAHLTPTRAWETGAGTIAFASVLFLVLPRRRRGIGILVAVLSVGALATFGCGSGAKPIDGGTGTGGSTTTTPTTVGTYTVNVTATGTNSSGQALTHTTFVTLNVQ